jgi:hypothetical protein
VHRLGVVVHDAHEHDQLPVLGADGIQQLSAGVGTGIPVDEGCGEQSRLIGFMLRPGGSRAVMATGSVEASR